MSTNFRKFGVELECFHPTQRTFDHAVAGIRAAGEAACAANYSGRNYREWQVKPDGSLSAAGMTLEIVSPVLPGTVEGIERAKKVARFFDGNGYKVNVSCGYHLNIDASDLTTQECAAIALRYNLHANELKTFLPRSRHAGTYTKFVAPGQAGWDKILRAALAPRSTEAWGHGERYTAVNLEHIHNGNTTKRIEFRQAAGTLNCEKIAGWYVAICDFIAETVKLVREHNATPAPVAVRPTNATRPTVGRYGRSSTVSETVSSLPPRVPAIIAGTDAERFLARLCSRRIITTPDAREFGWVTGQGNNIDSRLRVTAHALRRLGANLNTITYAGELAYTVVGFENISTTLGAITLEQIFTLPVSVRSRRVNDARNIEVAPVAEAPPPAAVRRQPLDQVLRSTPFTQGFSEVAVRWIDSRKSIFAEDIL
jgi:hypothetical protein